jgi:hypothetical protein
MAAICLILLFLLVDLANAALPSAMADCTTALADSSSTLVFILPAAISAYF